MGKKLLFLFIFFLICGCSTAKKAIPPKSLTNDRIDTPVVTGSLINSEAFKKGGALLLGSFKPGEGAAADEKTDRLSLMLIKGIQDALPQEKTHFTIAQDDETNPDLLLEGFIENYGHERIPHLVLRKNEVYLSVDGEIWMRETGEKIFSFETHAVINLKDQDPSDVAYQMGVAIARFIGSYAG